MSHFKRRLLNRVLDRLACLRTYVLACLCACVLCVHMCHLLGVLACLACLRVQVSAVIMLLAIKKELYIHKCMLTDVSLKVEIEFFNFWIFKCKCNRANEDTKRASMQTRETFEQNKHLRHVST